jgi:WD40 repeat protein
MAKVWDAKGDGEVLTLKGHTNVVRSEAFSPDGTRVVTASDDEIAKVWDAQPLGPEPAKRKRWAKPYQGHWHLHPAS